MNYQEKVDTIVDLLRKRDVKQGYLQINELLGETVSWIQEVATHTNTPSQSIIHEINDVLKEVTLAMKSNNIIYIIDLLKYDLFTLLLGLEDLKMGRKQG